MDSLSTTNLIKSDGTSVPATSALEGKDIVLYYFSAHWCPPCRQFTPMLKDFYEVTGVCVCVVDSQVHGDVAGGGRSGDCLHLL